MSCLRADQNSSMLFFQLQNRSPGTVARSLYSIKPFLLMFCICNTMATTAIRSRHRPDACEVKVELVAEFLNTTEAYLDSLSVLSARMGVVEKPEYERLYGIAQENRAKSERARTSLEAHVVSHGC